MRAMVINAITEADGSLAVSLGEPSGGKTILRVLVVATVGRQDRQMTDRVVHAQG
jgi:hypothetical protein